MLGFARIMWRLVCLSVCLFVQRSLARATDEHLQVIADCALDAAWPLCPIHALHALHAWCSPFYPSPHSFSYFCLRIPLCSTSVLSKFCFFLFSFFLPLKLDYQAHLSHFCSLVLPSSLVKLQAFHSPSFFFSPNPPQCFRAWQLSQHFSSLLPP